MACAEEPEDAYLKLKKTPQQFDTDPFNDQAMTPSAEDLATVKPNATPEKSRFSLSHNLKKLLGRQDHSPTPAEPSPSNINQRPGVTRRLSRKVIPGLPRPGTFKRQQSELRERLEPHKPHPDERRAVSVDRQNASAHERSPSAVYSSPRLSAPEMLSTPNIDAVLNNNAHLTNHQAGDIYDFQQNNLGLGTQSISIVDALSNFSDDDIDELQRELESRWILNLSMHFRDHSRREKFFITYAETPTRWRRVTISLDYRNAQPDTLEDDLQRIRLQRDKSAKIYEAIRESLPDIQFYDTVTNLKLVTEHDRLHVHVTEDIHEVIRFPSISRISHLTCARIPEDALTFASHLSGFVYKVIHNNTTYVKKEIPGPEAIDEFLYEINALHNLSGSQSVIQFHGAVISSDNSEIKGLLISFASRGALIDILYDHNGTLPFARRARWAREIITGLAEIHAAGYVQGDFTLSNIVVDDDDHAKIIDINRRGCPVGWEPPEIAALVESGLRVSMYIGVKTDLWQLGMVLWALAMQIDEPELRDGTLSTDEFEELGVPEWYANLVTICLSMRPNDRINASELLPFFPADLGDESAVLPPKREEILVEENDDDEEGENGYTYVSAMGQPAPSEPDSIPRGRSPLRRGDMPTDAGYMSTTYQPTYPPTYPPTIPESQAVKGGDGDTLHHDGIGLLGVGAFTGMGMQMDALGSGNTDGNGSEHEREEEGEHANANIHDYTNANGNDMGIAVAGAGGGITADAHVPTNDEMSNELDGLS